MELSSHGECCDFSDEKDLVNKFGGVAYDHDSMPKVVAVHTLSPERLNNQHSSIMDRLPRNIIGIRSKSKELRDLSIQRSCADLKEQGNSVKSCGNSLFQSSSFGLEQLCQRDSPYQNTLDTTRELETTSSPGNKTVKKRSSKPVMELTSSRDRTFQEKEPECMLQTRELLLTENVNKKEDYLKSSDAVTEVFPVAEKLSLPYEFNTKSVMFSEDNNTRNESLETLDWFSVGFLAEKSSDELNLQLCSGKGLTAERNSLGGQTTEGFNYESRPNSSIKALKVTAGGKFGGLDIDEDKKRCQETSSDTCTCKTSGKSSLEICMEGVDNQKQKTNCLIPRKRPRKSIPRKIDIERENFSGSHSTDSEETLSADEISSELSPNKCTPVVSPNCSRSDSISPRGTKVIFKRTAGVWSVSSLISDEKENKASTGTWSSNRETDADNDKQSKKICLFTDRPIAPLVIYDSLDTISEEHCFSPALDREIRIKELLRKREKLLEEVRQNRTTSQINLL